MFSILLFHFDEIMTKSLNTLCRNLGDFRFLKGDSWEECLLLLENQEIDCFFFHLDENFSVARREISYLRKMEAYLHTPIFLFSANLEYLVSAFMRWNSCEFFLLPLNKGKKAILLDLLQYYDKLYGKIHTEDTSCCCISTSKGIYHLDYKDILFVESEMKHSVIHMKNKTIQIPLPLYRVQEKLNSPYIVQTHRSFVVNLRNAARVDKTKTPWTISFFGSNEQAYVSRNYKKNLLRGLAVFSLPEED